MQGLEEQHAVLGILLACTLHALAETHAHTQVSQPGSQSANHKPAAINMTE